jgi:hypothetical protein
MVSVNFCVASGLTPLVALRQKVVVLAGEAVVLAMVALPLPLSVKVTPSGSADLEQEPKLALESAGVGVPVVVTLKLPAVPVVNEAELTLVIVGAWSVATGLMMTQ